jgi:N utilization substance protein B
MAARRRDAGVIDAHVREQPGFDKATRPLRLLLHGVIARRRDIDAVLAPTSTARRRTLSPIEHAILMIGRTSCGTASTSRYRVAINEAGAGEELRRHRRHKYVNGVPRQGRCAELRRVEARRPGPARSDPLRRSGVRLKRPQRAQACGKAHEW